MPWEFREDAPIYTQLIAQIQQRIVGGLLGPGDHVITTVCEHNSVLRPLYRLRTQGGQLSFAGVDAKGRLQYEKWEELAE